MNKFKEGDIVWYNGSLKKGICTFIEKLEKKDICLFLIKDENGNTFYTMSNNVLSLNDCAEIITNKELESLILTYKK